MILKYEGWTLAIHVRYNEFAMNNCCAGMSAMIRIKQV